MLPCGTKCHFFYKKRFAFSKKTCYFNLKTNRIGDDQVNLKNKC